MGDQERDRRAWKALNGHTPPGVVEEDDEDLSLGFSILKALSEQTYLREISPGVYIYEKLDDEEPPHDPGE